MIAFIRPSVMYSQSVYYIRVVYNNNDNRNRAFNHASRGKNQDRVFKTAAVGADAADVL